MPYPSPLQPLQPLRSPIPSSSSSSSSSSFDDQDLSDSFVIIPSDDDEVDIADTESTSTVNTALLDLLSDTSSERHPGSLSGSFHGSLSEVDDLNGPDEPGLDGSFTDAEATASLITDSHATLSGEPPELTPMPRPSLVNAANTGSQFRFIFPHLDLEASTASSGTYTDGRTPSGSVAHLSPVPPLGAIPSVTPSEIAAGPSISGIGNDQPFARLTEGRSKDRSPIRGVDEGWLKEARTWAPTHPAPPAPITMMMPSWEKGQYDQAQYDPYLPYEAPKAEPQGIVEEKNLLFPVEERQLQLKRALRAMVAAGAETNGNRWGILALASCALAILGAFGTGMPYSRRDSTSVHNTTHTAVSTGTTSLAEILVSTMTTTDASSATQTPRSAAQLIPDFQSIRDVISTFTSGSQSQDLETPESGSAGIRAESNTRKRKGIAHCADLAVAPVVALTLPREVKSSLSKLDDSAQTWIRSMANKVIRPTPPLIPSPPVDTVVPSCNCTGIPSLHTGNRYEYLLQRTRDYALSTSAAIAQLYYPMMLHLDHELKELSRLAAYIAERNMTQSAFRHLNTTRYTAMEIGRQLARASERQRMIGCERIHQLGKSANRVWEILARTIQGKEKLKQELMTKLADSIQKGQKVEQEIMAQVMQTAQDGIGKIGEKAEEVKIEGEKSLRKAKKGLDHIMKTRSMVAAERDVRVESGDGTPKEKKRRFTRARRIIRERRARGVRRQREATEGQDQQAIKTDTSAKGLPVKATGEKSKRRKLLDAVHHAAIQVALM